MNKFIHKVKAIFAGLPKQKDWQSFQKNDLPILFTPDEVQQFALDQRLNKSQTKAVAALQEVAPEAFREIVKSAPEQAATRIMDMADPFSMKERDNEPLSLSDLSAETIKTAARNAKRQPELIERHHPHVANNSENNEWYTPKEYTEAARAVMEGIDLDPASSEVANRNVRAKRYFSISENGLSKPWHGRVWMNPPYSSDLVGKFCSKLAEDYDAGTVTQACVLLNNATETKWFQALLKKAVAVCFPACRIRYLTEHGEPANSPLQGQAIFYLGRDKKRFADSFSKFGHILYGDL